MKLRINRMNPAEYFAVLGILELLSQQDSATRSYFEGSGNLVDFCTASSAQMPDLKQFSVEALPHAEAGIAPVLFGKMRLDWWLDCYGEEKSILKCWGGTTTPAGMLRNYQSLLQGECDLNFVAETKIKSCFNFDIRASRSALQAGYSFNDAKEAASLYPYAELLTAVGLQNFRPTRVKKGSAQYYTWRKAIATSIAHAACKQNIPGLGSESFEISFAKVGQLKEVSSVVSQRQSQAAAV